MSRAGEQFFRLPWRLTHALVSEEITRDEYVTLLYLCAKANHERCEDGVLVTSLHVIKSETSFGKTTARLRQLLDSLAAKGWITACARQGSSKWEIRLTAARVTEIEEKSAEHARQDFEVTSQTFEPGDSENTRSEAAQSERQLRNASRSLEVELELELDEERQVPAASVPLAEAERHRADHLLALSKQLVAPLLQGVDAGTFHVWKTVLYAAPNDDAIEPGLAAFHRARLRGEGRYGPIPATAAFYTSILQGHIAGYDPVPARFTKLPQPGVSGVDGSYLENGRVAA